MAISSTFVAADGDGYELQMGRWSRRLASPFIAFVEIAHAAHVLDVGCGTGNLAFELARTPGVAKVSGIDFSPVYVEHARQSNREPRIDFQVGDACALPFADATFDHALSMLVLQFVPRSDIAIAEMRRVTRPGGTIAAATWDTRGGFVAYRMLFDTAAMLDPAALERRKRVYTRPLSRPGELERAWQAAGLVDVVQDMITIRMDFASFADYWAPCEGKDGPMAEYVGSLDDATRSKVREGVSRHSLITGRRARARTGPWPSTSAASMTPPGRKCAKASGSLTSTARTTDHDPMRRRRGSLKARWHADGTPADAWWPTSDRHRFVRRPSTSASGIAQSDASMYIEKALR